VKLASATGRIALLVLSGSATLSLIGAIAETANTGPGGMAPTVSRPMPLQPPSDSQTGSTAPAPDQTREPRPVEPGAASPQGEVERWLRALTYAVTALAGFAAAGLIVLLRIAAALSRIAAR
jgi:hypothetical protein